MLRPCLVAVALAAAPALAAQPDPSVPVRLTPEHALEEVGLVRQALEDLHPGYERYTVPRERRAALEALERVARTGPDDVAWFGALSRLLATVRCEHTIAEPSERLEAYRAGGPSHLPFAFAIAQGRLVVTDPYGAAGLARGDEVLALDGFPVAEVIARVGALVAVDGFTDATRALKLWDDGDVLFRGLDHYLPHTEGFGGFVAARTLTVRSMEGGADRAVVVPLVSVDAFRALVGVERFSQDFADAVTVARPAPGVAVLRVGTFVNYRRPVDPDSVYRAALAPLHTAGVRDLIVDLRDNGGGSDDAAEALVRHLLPGPAEDRSAQTVKRLGVGALRPFLQTWDEAVFDPPAEAFEALPGGGFRFRSEPQTLMPAPDAFRGRVTLLTSRANASGATHLLARLQAAGLRTVGEETGGSSEGATAGAIVFLALPHSGHRVRVPLVRTHLGLATARPGYGVLPDVRVERTAAGLAAGRDEVLEAALTLVGEGRGG